MTRPNAFRSSEDRRDSPRGAAPIVLVVALPSPLLVGRTARLVGGHERSTLTSAPSPSVSGAHLVAARAGGRWRPPQPNEWYI